MTIGNLDDDGIDNDLMWHNPTTGVVGAWIMNYETLTAWQGLTVIATDQQWRAAN